MHRLSFVTNIRHRTHVTIKMFVPTCMNNIRGIFLIDESFEACSAQWEKSFI